MRTEKFLTESGFVLQKVALCIFNFTLKKILTSRNMLIL